MAHGRAIGKERNDEVRALVRKIVADHGNVAARAAKAIGVTPTTISDLLSEKRGAGTSLIDALSLYLKRDLAADLALSVGDVPPSRAPKEAVGAHPDWPEVSEQVFELKSLRYVPRPKIERGMAEVAAVELAQLPKRLTAEWVAKVLDPILDVLDDADAHKVNADDPAIEAAAEAARAHRSKGK